MSNATRVTSMLLCAWCAACGGGGGGGLHGTAVDCTFFQGSNCWKDLVQGIGACAESTSSTGALAGNLGTCTYGDGAVVTFTPALTLPIPNKYDWNFTMRKPGGAVCVTFAGTSGKTTVTGAAGTFTEEVIGSGLQLTCPNGSAYHADNALSLLDCLDSLPGDMNSSSSSDVDFSLMGGPGNAPLHLFNCAQ